MLVLLLGGALLALMSVPQGHALAAPGPAPRPTESLKEVKALMSRDAFFSALGGQPIALAVPLQDVNAVMQDMAGRLVQGGARAELKGDTLMLHGSVPLERTPLKVLSALGAWANVTVTLGLKAEGAPTLDGVRVGRLNLPPDLVLWGAQRVLESQELLAPAQLMMAALSQVNVQDDRLNVTVRWTDQLQGQTLALVVPAEDWPRLQAYHAQVVAAIERVPPGSRMHPGHPLRELLRTAFVLAQQRTMAHGLLPATEGTLPASEVAYRENRAALVAVALAANKLSLHQLLTRVDGQDVPPLPMASVRLNGREDFAQHYTISALMALMVGGRVADTVGLYKEMMDASKADGGSGFSFNDLALNRAGIRLGQRARQDAIGLQQRLGGDEALVSDDDFIPKVDDLPEFLGRDEFVHRYGGLKDGRFQRQM
ncbi:MAG: hypothetical protein ACK4TS_11355, partial [Aquabacterium sp.]